MWRYRGMLAHHGHNAATSRAAQSDGRTNWYRVWWQRLSRVWAAISRDKISIMAAAAAYYSMLSLFPAMSAGVLTYGLVASPVTIEYDIDVLSGVLPGPALKLVSDQLENLVTAPPTKLGLGLMLSLLFAVWSATSATTAMMTALTIAYDGEEKRGVLRFYGLAMALTAAIAMLGVLSLLLIAAVPTIGLELPGPWSDIVPLMRWPLLALLALLGLGALYRIAPSRNEPSWDFFRAGTISASVLWLAGSVAFSFYASNFSSYDRTYGSLGAVVMLLVWLYVSAYVVLAGAELNREIEQERGRRQPK
jgi:membrane protein